MSLKGNISKTVVILIVGHFYYITLMPFCAKKLYGFLFFLHAYGGNYFLSRVIMPSTRSNPKPSTIKGVVTREAGTKPKPHEYYTAEALADSELSIILPTAWSWATASAFCKS